MDESLAETKRRLSAKHLGRAGIHGIGQRQSNQSICVYLQQDDSPEQQEELRQLKTEAAPYGVVVLDSAPAKVQ